VHKYKTEYIVGFSNLHNQCFSIVKMNLQMYDFNYNFTNFYPFIFIFLKTKLTSGYIAFVWRSVALRRVKNKTPVL